MAAKVGDIVYSEGKPYLVTGETDGTVSATALGNPSVFHSVDNEDYLGSPSSAENLTDADGNPIYPTEPEPKSGGAKVTITKGKDT